jgi:hypothetical protein
MWMSSQGPGFMGPPYAAIAAKMPADSHMTTHYANSQLLRALGGFMRKMSA